MKVFPSTKTYSAGVLECLDGVNGSLLDMLAIGIIVNGRFPANVLMPVTALIKTCCDRDFY